MSDAVKVAENKKNEMAPQSGGFLAAIDSLEMIQDAMNGELEGLTFSPDRISIPTGGGTMFQVNQPDSDEPEMVKSIDGVIVFQHPAYSYYKEAYTGGNNPPDCGSFDGVTGAGTPGGECNNCPYNRFGSGQNGAKACKNRRMLYIQIEGQLLPVMLSIPTGSLRNYTDFVKHQLSQGRRISQIVTRLSLVKATSKSGIAYSQIAFKFVRKLSDDEIKALAPVAGMMSQYAQSLTMQALAEPESFVPEGESELPFK